MVADRRTALKRARELFDRGDRRGASRALLEAGFSGAQVEAVFEGFLLEPSKSKEARPGPPPAATPPPPRPSPAPPTRARRAIAPRIAGGGELLRALRKRPWAPAAAGAGAVLVAALLLLPRPAAVDPQPPTLSPAVSPSVESLDLSRVASIRLDACGWTGDEVRAAVRFLDADGRLLALSGGLEGALFGEGTLAETVHRTAYENRSGFLWPVRVDEKREPQSLQKTTLSRAGNDWMFRSPAARTPLNSSDTASYLADIRVQTSLSPVFTGSCAFGWI